MTYQEEVERYICTALCYPLKDQEHLVAMVCCHFPDVNEIAARTIIDNLRNRLCNLEKRGK